MTGYAEIASRPTTVGRISQKARRPSAASGPRPRRHDVTTANVAPQLPSRSSTADCAALIPSAGDFCRVMMALSCGWMAADTCV